jgi:hypothetical protein
MSVAKMWGEARNKHQVIQISPEVPWLKLFFGILGQERRSSLEYGRVLDINELLEDHYVSSKCWGWGIAAHLAPQLR